MRFKISLKVHQEVAGNAIPVSYQYELSSCIRRLLTADRHLYSDWLNANLINYKASKLVPLQSISNLYIPHVFVQGDRLCIRVPRVQFWISFAHNIGTEDLVRRTLSGQKFYLGDHRSHVAFEVSDIVKVASAEIKPTMELRSMAPVVVGAVRPNGTLEYLDPVSPMFSEFLLEGLIERWEMLHGRRFMGDRNITIELLQPPSRKGIVVRKEREMTKKVFGNLLKFRVSMDPKLLEFAYNLGIGDSTDEGFGYLELLNKQAE